MQQQLDSTGSKRPWESRRFDDNDSDPLVGFANIMDVMLVFALGLMVALIAQNDALKKTYEVNSAYASGMEISKGKELIDVPDTIKQQLNTKTSGMKSLGTVYRDPTTGKLILIGESE